MLKISVIVPTYNVEKFVEKALGSLLSQKRQGFSLEIIIVDDSSTDKTYEICCQFASKHNEIKVYRNFENLKICKTLNKALSYSTGELILRMDGDDISLPNRISVQLDYFLNKKLDVVGCQMIAIDEQDNELSRGTMPVGIDNIYSSCKYFSPIAHIWLATRKVYDVLGGYRNIPYAEDYDFILRALDRGFICDNSPEHLMLIRQRQGNTASTASLKQRKTHRYVLELHKRRLANKSDDDGFSEEELARKIRSWPITEKLHIYSTNLLSSAYCDKNVFRKFFKIILCCSLSYYNFEYLLSRIMFKRTFM